MNNGKCSQWALVYITHCLSKCFTSFGRKIKNPFDSNITWFSSLISYLMINIQVFVSIRGALNSSYKKWVKKMKEIPSFPEFSNQKCERNTSYSTTM